MLKSILKVVVVVVVVLFVACGDNDNPANGKPENKTYTLSTGANPQAGGSVYRNPNKTSYDYGEQVTVTAAAASGYLFNGWSGASSSTSSPVTVNMYSNLSLTANFQQLLPGGGGGNITGNGVVWTTTGDCSSSCSGYIFRSDGTMNVILYIRNSNSCSNVSGGYSWSTNGNKVFLGFGGAWSEFGTISGNTLTINSSGNTYTRTTGVPCSN